MDEGNKFSIDNLKKVIVIAAKIGNIAGKALEDGKITMADFALLPEFLMIFPAFIEIKWDQVLPEAKDLSAAEATELVNTFNTAFDIPQDKLENNIEKVLAIIAQLVNLVFGLISIFKK